LAVLASGEDKENPNAGNSSFHEVERRDVAAVDPPGAVPDFKRLSQDLVSVAEMQRRIMPDPLRLTVFGDFDIFGKTIPIEIVGGDFYDFIDLEGRFGLRGKMGIVIADASGHGLVPAMLIRDFNTALYMGISLQAHYEKDTTPLLFSKMNRRMFRSSVANQFITAFYGELHLDGTLRYVNAGHYSPLLFRKGGIEELDVGGPVLGAFLNPPMAFKVGEARLEREDILVCYTDGISEANDCSGEEYGAGRLVKLVESHRRQSSLEIFNTIIADVKRFSEGCKQSDDRTVIVIKRR
jgi:sigma-B regulation protein RsbU (phosphoserine phosphatase)